MQLKPLPVLVHRALYPHPRHGDPVSFIVHVNRHLIPETRVEVLNFYGSLDSVEAQYPGLNYTHWPHRRRLERFPHHRRLFRVFMELKLTRDEILSLCQWEGTKSAKEKYERDTRTLIRDTTADEIAPADEVIPPFATLVPDTEARSDRSTPYRIIQFLDGVEPERCTEGEALDIHDEPRTPVPSLGSPPMPAELYDTDERWPQWLQEAAERNHLDIRRMMEAIRDGRPFPISPTLTVDATRSPPALTLSNPAPPLTSNPSNQPLPSPALTSNDQVERLDDTEVAMVNVWSLEHELIRSTRSTVTASSTTPAAR